MKYLTSLQDLSGKRIEKAIDLLNLKEEVALIFDDGTWTVLRAHNEKWEDATIIEVADSCDISIRTEFHAGVITQKEFDKKLEELDTKAP